MVVRRAAFCAVGVANRLSVSMPSCRSLDLGCRCGSGSAVRRGGARRALPGVGHLQELTAGRARRRCPGTPRARSPCAPTKYWLVDPLLGAEIAAGAQRGRGDGDPPSTRRPERPRPRACPPARPAWRRLVEVVIRDHRLGRGDRAPARPAGASGAGDLAAGSSPAAPTTAASVVRRCGPSSISSTSASTQVMLSGPPPRLARSMSWRTTSSGSSIVVSVWCRVSAAHHPGQAVGAEQVAVADLGLAQRAGRGRPRRCRRAPAAGSSAAGGWRPPPG